MNDSMRNFVDHPPASVAVAVVVVGIAVEGIVVAAVVAIAVVVGVTAVVVVAVAIVVVVAIEWVLGLIPRRDATNSAVEKFVWVDDVLPAIRSWRCCGNCFFF